MQHHNLYESCHQSLMSGIKSKSDGWNPDGEERFNIKWRLRVDKLRNRVILSGAINSMSLNFTHDHTQFDVLFLLDSGANAKFYHPVDTKVVNVAPLWKINSTRWINNGKHDGRKMTDVLKLLQETTGGHVLSVLQKYTILLLGKLGDVRCIIMLNMKITYFKQGKYSVIRFKRSKGGCYLNNSLQRSHHPPM